MGGRVGVSRVAGRQAGRVRARNAPRLSGPHALWLCRAFACLALASLLIEVIPRDTASFQGRDPPLTRSPVS